LTLILINLYLFFIILIYNSNYKDIAILKNRILIVVEFLYSICIVSIVNNKRCSKKEVINEDNVRTFNLRSVSQIVL
jgi:hypothetical protein